MLGWRLDVISFFLTLRLGLDGGGATSGIGKRLQLVGFLRAVGLRRWISGGWNGTLLGVDRVLILGFVLLSPSEESCYGARLPRDVPFVSSLTPSPCLSLFYPVFELQCLDLLFASEQQRPLRHVGCLDV